MRTFISIVVGHLDWLRSRMVAAGGCALTIVCLTGCASYTTEQTDKSYEGTNQVRAITTKVTARTFLAAKSELAKSAVVNTDKSQSSKVGSVSQEANAESLVEAAVRGAVKGAKP